MRDVLQCAKRDKRSWLCGAAAACTCFLCVPVWMCGPPCPRQPPCLAPMMMIKTTSGLLALPPRCDVTLRSVQEDTAVTKFRRMLRGDMAEPHRIASPATACCPPHTPRAPACQLARDCVGRQSSNSSSFPAAAGSALVCLHALVVWLCAQSRTAWTSPARPMGAGSCACARRAGAV